MWHVADPKPFFITKTSVTGISLPYSHALHCLEAGEGNLMLQWASAPSHLLSSPNTLPTTAVTGGPQGPKVGLHSPCCGEAALNPHKWKKKLFLCYPDSHMHPAQGCLYYRQLLVPWVPSPWVLLRGHLQQVSLPRAGIWGGISPLSSQMLRPPWGCVSLSNILTWIGFLVKHICMCWEQLKLKLKLSLHKEYHKKVIMDIVELCPGFLEGDVLQHQIT